jgi:hypothetical protein
VISLFEQTGVGNLMRRDIRRRPRRARIGLRK